MKPYLQNYAFPCLHFYGSKPWHTQALIRLNSLIDAYESEDTAWEFEVLEHLLAFWKLLYLHADTETALSMADQRTYEGSAISSLILKPTMTLN